MSEKSPTHWRDLLEDERRTEDALRILGEEIDDVDDCCVCDATENGRIVVVVQRKLGLKTTKALEAEGWTLEHNVGCPGIGESFKLSMERKRTVFGVREIAWIVRAAAVVGLALVRLSWSAGGE